MKRIVGMGLIALMLSSCGVFRSVNKDKYQEKVHTEVREEFNNSETSSVVDSSKTLIVETIDGKAVSKEVEHTEDINLDRLDSLKEVEFEDMTGLLSIRLSLDSLRNLKVTVKKKEEVIPVLNAGTRVIHKQNNITTQTNKSQAVIRSENQDKTISSKVVKKEPKNILLLVLIGAGVLLMTIATLYILIRRRL